jgi:hypothetical protein
MSIDTEAQGGMKQTIIWIGVMLAAVVAVAYFVA